MMELSTEFKGKKQGLNYLPFEHCTISLKHWLMHAESSASQFVMHSNESSSHRSVQARFKSGTLKMIALKTTRPKMPN